MDFIYKEAVSSSRIHNNGNSNVHNVDVLLKFVNGTPVYYKGTSWNFLDFYKILCRKLFLRVLICDCSGCKLL